MARRNTGSIRQKRPGVFQVAVDLSRVKKLTPKEWARPSTRQRRYETVEGTREDAERRLHELQYEADTGTLPTGKMTLNVWLDYWLREYVVPERRIRTVEDYRMQVRNYIGPMLGAMFLSDIKPHHVREFQNRLAARLGSSTVRKIRQILSGALREAWNNDLIPYNPVQKTPAPKLAEQKVVAPSVERVQQFLAAAADDKYFPVFRLMAYTGMRVGEALGLEWRHVDVANGMVLVRQTLVTAGAGLQIGPPKSEKGRREIPLDDETLDVLMAHRGRQDAQRERMGARYEDRGMVFPNGHGGLLHVRTIERTIRKYAPDMHPHQLRHFFATQLMEAGIALSRVSSLLGHSTIAVTANTYIHPDAAGDRDAIELLATRMAVGNGGELAAIDVDTLISTTN